MPTQSSESSSAFNMQDLLLAVVKYKWIILVCALAGIGAAAAIFVLTPKSYESEAKLLVRYVVDRSAIDPEQDGMGKPGGRTGDSVMNSEIQILTSSDLAVQVAEAVGPKRILPKAANPTVGAAANAISGGLLVTAPKGSSVLFVSYANRDPEIATLVLTELVTRYFTKHLEIHRSAGAFDFVTQQADQARSQLTQTEDQLKTAKGKAGVISLVDSTAALNAELVKSGDDLRNAEIELAEQQARVKQMERALGRESSSSTEATPPPAGESSDAAPKPAASDIQKYQSLVSRIAQLQKINDDLLTKYTAENRLVVLNRQQMESLESERTALEKKFPVLSSTAPSGASSAGQVSTLGAEQARLAGLIARVATLKARVQTVQQQAEKFSSMIPEIAELERQKEIQETKYKYLEQSLEKARIDEALDPSKIPNISVVQKPSLAMVVNAKRDKIALALAAGGIALGFGIAFALELLLNRTVKRPLELETKLHIPLLVSIPYNPGAGKLKLPWKKGGAGAVELGGSPRGEIAPWDPAHFIRPFCEGLRDRLGLFFQLNNITHKPKLVGVTGFSKGAGTSTIATGLAAALSETGDGKVLLVNMNTSHADVHPFFEGRPTMSLDDAVKPGEEHEEAVSNLYLATPDTTNGSVSKQGLKRFHSLLPQFEASNYDYIIFDLPPLGQTSPTVAMAGLMDKVLMVVESEKSDPNLIKRSFAELIAAKANVSAVFNKEKSYLPKWLTKSEH